VALGARRAQLMRMVLRQTLKITATGVLIGILLGVGLTMGVRSQLYGIGSVEWTVLVAVSVAMLAISLMVAFLSARSWVTVDPMEAVRHA
jgi:putative ABC transport system permease protein